MAEDIEKRKLLSALAHGSGLFSIFILSIGIPIIIIFATNDPVTKKNAKEALNFELTLLIVVFTIIMLFMGLISFVFSVGGDSFSPLFSIMLLIIIPFLFLFALFEFVMPIVAVIQVLTNPYKVYRYPLTLRII